MRGSLKVHIYVAGATDEINFHADGSTGFS